MLSAAAAAAAATAACRHYRKVVVSSIPQLNYLDDAPVADQDRRLAAAFMQVG
jgi:outer membrane protein assembly factor BamE (lipoprotein component of BamABCDE complex)